MNFKYRKPLATSKWIQSSYSLLLNRRFRLDLVSGVNKLLASSMASKVNRIRRGLVTKLCGRKKSNAKHIASDGSFGRCKKMSHLILIICIPWTNTRFFIENEELAFLPFHFFSFFIFFCFYYSMLIVIR